MFGFSHGGPERGRGPRGRRPEFDPERFFHWIERLNDGGRTSGGGRSRRMFDGGELRLVLLKLIADEPRHGYDLIRAVEQMTGGAYAPSPGVVYPTLTLLGEMGQIEEQASEGAKKRFGVTDAGLAELKERADEVAALIERLTAIGEHRGRADQAPIRRALGNVRFATKARMMAGADEAVLHEIAGILDEAAQKIERLK